MKLCDNSHDEICYESRECPCCALLLQHDQDQTIINALETRVDELNSHIKELNE